MTEIEGKRCLTINASSGTDYAVTYPEDQYLDIVNCTSGNILISSEAIGADNYAVIPAGGSYNSWQVSGWKIYIQASSSGLISIIAR